MSSASKVSAIKSEVKAAFINWISPDAKPVQVVSFPEDITAGGAPTFHYDKIQKIVSRDTVQDLEVFALCITGKLRSGKSFLLNLMKTYLEYYAKNDHDEGWENQTDVKIAGGAWAKGTDSVTHGIWVWDEPYILHGKAILLVDCQGLGDTMYNDKALDILILYIGCEVSNVQIVNLKETFEGKDLELLQTCTWYGKMPGIRLSSHTSALYDNLIFLIRDFNVEPFGRRDKEFDKIENSKVEEVRQNYLGIRRSFSSISTYTMPEPGKTVRRNSEIDKRVTIKDCDEEFLQAAKQLFYVVFLCLPSESSLRKGREILQRFKGMEKRIKSIRTPQQALNDSMLNKAFIEAGQLYDSLFEKAYGMTFGSNEEIEAYLHQIVDDAIELFEKNHSYKTHSDHDLKRKYREILEDRKSPIFIQDKVMYILKALETVRLYEECEKQRKLVMKKMKKTKYLEKRWRVQQNEEEEQKRQNSNSRRRALNSEIRQSLNESEGDDNDDKNAVKKLVSLFEKKEREFVDQADSLERAKKKMATKAFQNMHPLAEEEKWSEPKVAVRSIVRPTEKPSKCIVM